MDAVLGLSMTPTSVGLVLVEGQDADGATMDRDSFAVSHGPINTAEQATAAVKRTEAMAANRGLRLHSIGVTWSEDADAEASMLMRSLSESGFDNVVAIRMPEATEALARGIADVLGYATTAVCVIEPGAAISLIVNTSDGAVQTAFNHAVDSDDALIAWLSTIFTRADWEPEALVLVGSVGDFGPLIAQLEEALSVPVFAPEAATLALARGAALASAQTVDAPLDVFDEYDRDDYGSDDYGSDDYKRADVAPRTTRLRPWDVAPARQSALLRVGPAAMLATGLVTFVVSVSIAVSLQLAPNRETPTAPVPAARTETPAAVRPAPPVMPPPVAIPPAPVVEAALPDAPPPEAPPPVYEEAPAPIADVPAEAPPAPEAPAADPGPVDPALAPPAADTPVQNVQPPSVYTPSPVYQGPPPVEKKPGIWTRIKEKLTPGPG